MMIAAVILVAISCKQAPENIVSDDNTDTSTVPIVTTYKVGEFEQGGVIFWVDNTGQHGLVCAINDQSTAMRWFAGTNGYTQARGNGIYAGMANTTIIIASQVAIGDDNDPYAARLCNQLQVAQDGIQYGDWYLPSRGELNLVYLNKGVINSTAINNGGTAFADEFYWSSREYDSRNAYEQNFEEGSQFFAPKTYPGRVRAIRTF